MSTALLSSPKNPEILLSGREVAKLARTDIKTVVRAAICGKVRPDFITHHDRLLFRAASVAEVVNALTK